jgi:hypothetical protein
MNHEPTSCWNRQVAGAAFALSLLAAQAAATDIPAKEATMLHARGEFEVKVTPAALDGPAEDASLSRYSLVKTLTGDFVGEAKGQMLAGMGSVPTSGAYVAVERLTGRLGGREGSFLLFHRGVMSNGNQEMLVEVVPDSGTGALAGLRGTFRIVIEGKKHLYDFEYELQPAP